MASSSSDRVTEAIRFSSEFKGRPRDRDGEPGGLVELTRKHKPLIVGDLHACRENLERILEHNGNRRRLESGQLLLVLLGDTVHNDQTGQLREMASSLEMLEYIFDLFHEFKGNIVYLRGNHDSFDENLVKSGIRQGQEFRAYVKSRRGAKYTQAVERFFTTLPVFIRGPNYLITHAGPVRWGATREELINIRSEPDKYLQLQWNRINEFRGTPSLKEYDEHDIRRSLEKLGLPPGTHFIVGHNPLWNTGNSTGVWLNVLGIAGHHILYSGCNTRAPYLRFAKEELEVHYAITAKAEVLYA